VTRRANGERGESLIELLITIVIMSTAIISIIAGIAVASDSSGEQKQQTAVSLVLHDYAEAIMAGSYTGGCGPPTFTYVAPVGYSVDPPTATGWYDGTSSPSPPTSFATTCPGASATAERLTLHAYSNDQRADQTLEIVRGVDYVRPSP
jgi:type II secretory pathway pseudopilin PulG